ncbi:MAG: hypothetical protein K1Y36_24815 [Blastocatellia bacterium]|nr:hypothetical protein [Blastocatellia bacterium]
MIHIRFEGQSVTLPEHQNGFAARLTDAEIKRLAAQHLDVAVNRLNPYVVDRTPQGNVIVRPEAVYG